MELSEDQKKQKVEYADRIARCHPDGGRASQVIYDVALKAFELGVESERKRISHGFELACDHALEEIKKELV